MRYETPAAGVARIVLDRPEKRNAPGKAMAFDLGDAFRRACHDDQVRVIILAAAGEAFSDGHDIDLTDPTMPTAARSRGWWGQYGGAGWGRTASASPAPSGPSANMLRHGHFIDISRLPPKVRDAIRRAARNGQDSNGFFQTNV